MGNTNNGPGLSQTYIEQLTLELTDAENCYNEYHKAAQKAKAEYIRAKDWENCLKSFLDKLKSTYGMVSALDIEIESFIIHAKKVCETLGYAKEATNILIICMRCLSKQNEELKKSTKDLLDIIDCLNDPILDTNVSIMKCLADFKTKVDAGVVANLAAIKELLNLMMCILELEYKVCASDEEPQGLIEDLKRLIAVLNCTYPHESSSSDVNCDKVNQAYATPSDLDCPNCQNDCNDSIPAEANELKCDKNDIKPELCIECGTGYLKKLSSDYSNAAGQACYAKCILDYFNGLEQKAKSNFDAVKAALDAAQAAKDKCK